MEWNQSKWNRRDTRTSSVKIVIRSEVSPKRELDRNRFLIYPPPLLNQILACLKRDHAFAYVFKLSYGNDYYICRSTSPLDNIWQTLATSGGLGFQTRTSRAKMIYFFIRHGLQAYKFVTIRSPRFRSSQKSTQILSYNNPRYVAHPRRLRQSRHNSYFAIVIHPRYLNSCISPKSNPTRYISVTKSYCRHLRLLIFHKTLLFEPWGVDHLLSPEGRNLYK